MAMNAACPSPTTTTSASTTRSSATRRRWWRPSPRFFGVLPGGAVPQGAAPFAFNKGSIPMARRTAGGPAGPSQRQLRVAEEVRHALASVLARADFRDPELIGVRVTVTEVRASPDLKHMTAFVSGLGKPLPEPKLT